MNIRWIVAALASVVAVVSGCGNESKSGVGLRLPEGDVAEGKTAFVEIGCVRCHSVYGEDDLPAPVEADKLELGGRGRYVKSYGQLVTAIINPSHSISGQAPQEVREAGTSPMQNFNKTMTVAQMIDLVAFLHSKYVGLKPHYDPAPF